MSKKIEMQVKNGSGYETIYPVPAGHKDSHISGDDKITPADIGAQGKIEITSTPKDNTNIWIDPNEDGAEDFSSVKTLTGTIGTTWVENEDTGVKSQQVAITGILSTHTAKVDHDTASIDGTSDGYATFVEEENQYLTYITNGYAETYDGGITFYIFGDAPTVNIPIVAEVA